MKELKDYGLDTGRLDELIVNLARGDMDALAQLYHLTASGIYAYALSVLKNSHDAEDVLHDCFVSIHAAADTYRSAGKPMAWILTITRNLCYKILRQRSRSVQLDMEDWREHLELSCQMDADERLLLESCMEKLSDQERQIVVLHAVAGVKHIQIAQLLDLALPTVLSKYHRALKKLRQYM